MRHSVSESLLSGRHYGVLLVALLVLFGVEPFLRRLGFGQLLFQLAWTWVLVSSTVAAGAGRSVRVLAGALAAIAMLLAWFDPDAQSMGLHLLRNAAGISVLCVVVYGVVRHLLTTHDVTADSIYGSVCAYLLICLAFALLFSSIERIAPGSFQAGGAALEEMRESDLLFTYYSIVTITTLGYGDVSAANPAVGIVAGLEAMLGQMYLAVLVARLVALHVARATREAR